MAEMFCRLDYAPEQEPQRQASAKNNRCAHHCELLTNDAKTHYVYAVEDGERVLVERYLYRSRDGKREFFLCDICHAAVDMVKPNCLLSREAKPETTTDTSTGYSK